MLLELGVVEDVPAEHDVGVPRGHGEPAERGEQGVVHPLRLPARDPLQGGAVAAVLRHAENENAGVVDVRYVA